MGQSAAKLHEKRIQRCMQSFQQLQADIRHINLHCAPEFAREPTELEAAVNGADGSPPQPLLLQFRPFTKLTKKSALPWLWKINENVLITATVTPKSVADAAIAAAASNSPPAPINPKYPSFSLTIKEFYHLFLYYCDNLKTITALREQILKIEHPDQYEAIQEARRQQTLHAHRKAAGDSSESEEEKSPVTITRPSPLLNRQSSVPLDCCICLSTPDEEGLGNELVVLPCLHSFCSNCINDWKSHSAVATCPLCRRELSDGPQEEDEWILTSPNLEQLKSQFDKVIAVPYDFIHTRPTFPPNNNTKGPKSAGDVFSLALGEVIDVFGPSKKSQQRKSVTSTESSPPPAVAVGPASSNVNQKEQPEEDSSAPQKVPPASQSSSALLSSPTATIPVAEPVLKTK